MSSARTVTNTYHIHVLMRGDRSESDEDPEDDEYLSEFRNRGLYAVHVPVLDINYMNLDRLADLIERKLASNCSDLGLIITSPRVVTSLVKAVAHHMEDRESLMRLNEESVFVVGKKTGRICRTKLGIGFNKSSEESGSGADLAEYITRVFAEKRGPTTLIYPRSSLANDVIEERLKMVDSLYIESLVVYETKTISDLARSIHSAVENCHEFHRDAGTRFVLNLVMFSPSGVTGLTQVDWTDLKYRLSKTLDLQSERVEFKYSSIGQTTANSLRQGGFKVLAQANKPEPKSLVDCILAAIN